MQPRHTINDAELKQLLETFAERRGVAEIATRYYDMIRNLPRALLQEFGSNGLLAFDAKRIDRIYQIDRFVFGKFPNNAHRIIEVAIDLQDDSPVVQTLGQLCVTDLSARHEDRAFKSGSRRIGGQTRRRVSSAGAHDCAGAEDARLRDGRGHSRVFERAGRIAALMFELQPIQTAIAGRARCVVEWSVALGQRNDRSVGRKWQELAVAPDAAAIFLVRGSEA